MADKESDFQVFLWKTLEFSSKTCATFIINYPFISLSLLGSFLLYISFPSLLWFLIYSLPVVVLVAIVLRIFFGLGNCDRSKEEDNRDGMRKETRVAKNGKTLTHARSVRRRRAKNLFVQDNAACNEEEKSAVFSAIFNHEMVDKSAVVEESPKEIREVEVDSSFVNVIKEEGPRKFTSSGKWEDEGDRRSWIVDNDNQKTATDVGISEVERTKRLESMIARRRARKLLSLQVKKTLMNVDRNDRPAHLASLVIPKHEGSSFPGNGSSQLSPVPGSAPSVMMPMGNPFDIPYDPHEEKPDLRGGSFQQEFSPGHQNDGVFCRHESFRLGAFLPGKTMQNRGGGSRAFQASNRGNKATKQMPCTCTETAETNEPETDSSRVEESNSMADNGEDQIKEVIQVQEKGDSLQEDMEEDVQEESIPINESSTKQSSTSSSSEENESFYKIDRGAILKSLSALGRRTDTEVTEDNDQMEVHSSYETFNSSDNRLSDHLSSANIAGSNHKKSFSIASDMQVEVSEISSPPLTINENNSSRDGDGSTHDVDMDKEIAWAGEELWEGSSHLPGVSNSESQSRESNEEPDQDMLEVPRVVECEDSQVVQSMPNCEDIMNTPPLTENRGDHEETQHREGGQHFAEVGVIQVTADAGISPHASLLMRNVVGRQIPEILSSLMSPNSVLQPAFSLDQSVLSSFDQDVEAVQQFAIRERDTISPVTSINSELSTTIPDIVEQVEVSQERPDDSEISTLEHTYENGPNLEETASCSLLALKNCGAPSEMLKPAEESIFISYDSNCEASRQSLEAENSAYLSTNREHMNSSNPSTEEELTENQENINEETVLPSDTVSIASYDDRREYTSEVNVEPGQHSNHPDDDDHMTKMSTS